MQTHANNILGLRIITFLVAALAAASAAYWVLKWTGTASVLPLAAPILPAPRPVDPQAVARLLGGGQTAALVLPADSVASRFKLTGVVADRAQSGYALISVDGKPAKPYRVGALVIDALVLHSVAPRSAAFAASLDAPVAFTLELPTLARSDGKVARAGSE